jgi:hypothetical protein
MKGGGTGVGETWVVDGIAKARDSLTVLDARPEQAAGDQARGAEQRPPRRSRRRNHGRAALLYGRTGSDSGAVPVMALNES